MNTEAATREEAQIPFLDKEAAQLMARLGSDPFSFDFFHAVRRIDALRIQARTGYSDNPSSEQIRYGQTPSLQFAPSTLARFDLDFQPGSADFKAKMSVFFTGLCGPNGPMPLTLTEFIDRRMRGIVDPDSLQWSRSDPSGASRTQKDFALADFLDIFNHRVLSLFYRAWADVRKTVDCDRGSDDRFAYFFGSFVGLGMESLMDRTAIPDAAKYYFSGHLSCKTRHAQGLASILEDYHGVSARIVEFVGHWLRLPESSICRLGESPETGRIGDSLVVGSRCWDCQLCFRIRLGPMSLREYERFLPAPDAVSLRDLELWVLHYVGQEFFVEVQLVLQEAEVPEIALGQSGRLGYTSWLRDVRFQKDADGKTSWTQSAPFGRDADDFVVRLKLETSPRRAPAIDPN